MVRAIVEYQAVEEASTTKVLTLKQNSPNPVLNKATISYTLPAEAKVELEIYDATGRIVKTLANEVQSSGNKAMEWNKRNTSGELVSAGIYFYRLTAGHKTITKTMIVL
jgi:flagellar hook assembly protein FlgD